jgi:hypothetical protein
VNHVMICRKSRARQRYALGHPYTLSGRLLYTGFSCLFLTSEINECRLVCANHDVAAGVGKCEMATRKKWNAARKFFCFSAGINDPIYDIARRSKTHEK